MIVSSDRALGPRLSSDRATLLELTSVNLSLLVSGFSVGFEGPPVRCMLELWLIIGMVAILLKRWLTIRMVTILLE